MEVNPDSRIHFFLSLFFLFSFFFLSSLLPFPFLLSNEGPWKSAWEPWGLALKLWVIFQPQDFLHFRKSQCYFKGKRAVLLSLTSPPSPQLNVALFFSFFWIPDKNALVLSSHRRGCLNIAPHLSCSFCFSPSKGRLAANHKDNQVLSKTGRWTEARNVNFSSSTS